MYKVLIVDDAIFMRKIIRTMLERNGFQVVGEAKNGAIGVSKYNELHPDIVTMNITMQEMTGIDALKVIRQQDPKAKVVMVSAMGQEALVTEAVMNGAKSFIVKPFQEEHIVKTLKAIVSRNP